VSLRILALCIAIASSSLAGCDPESPSPAPDESVPRAVEDFCNELLESKGLVLEPRDQQALSMSLRRLADRLNAAGEGELADVALGISKGLEESRKNTGGVLYLIDGTTRSEASEVEMLLQTTAGVDSVTYVSSQAALEAFRDLYEERPEMYEALGPGDLPPAFRFSPESKGVLHEVRHRLRNHPLVEEIRSGSKFGGLGRLPGLDDEQVGILKAAC
jgi:FtsX extracellular domain